jgi:23S rRNA (adenine2503-C2)-methyltransferase
MQNSFFNGGNDEMKTLIYDYSLEQLQDWLQSQGEPRFRAQQLYDWLYVKRVHSFAEMSNLSKTLRAKLDEEFSIDALREVARYESKDGTVKFLFALQDDYTIETVLMKHNYGISICVTTQVGCRIGCTFCASTLGGLKRNLTSGEIVSQVVTAQQMLDERGERISSLVVMGSGEPFENYDALLAFLRTIIHPLGLHIGQRHITVSSSGIVPNMYRFADEDLQIGLAISLHAPNDALRSRLMPVNRRYPFADVLDACRYYIAKSGRRMSIEYALIGGVNDQDEQALELAQAIKGMMVHVNLIPVNYVPERDYVRTPRNQIFTFCKLLQDNGVNATIRREQGHDIEAACGQLRAKHMKSEANSKRVRPPEVLPYVPKGL